MKYKLICMSFDGEYKTERPEFDSIEDAHEYSNDLGSKWFFYPFHFVTTESGKTIVDNDMFFPWVSGKRVATVQKIFNKHSKRPEMENANIEEFALTM